MTVVKVVRPYGSSGRKIGHLCYKLYLLRLCNPDTLLNLKKMWLNHCPKISTDSDLASQCGINRTWWSYIPLLGEEIQDRILGKE